MKIGFLIGFRLFLIDIIPNQGRSLKREFDDGIIQPSYQMGRNQQLKS